MAAVTGAVRLAVVGAYVGAADAGRDDVVGLPRVAGTFALITEAADSALNRPNTERKLSGRKTEKPRIAGLFHDRGAEIRTQDPSVPQAFQVSRDESA